MKRVFLRRFAAAILGSTAGLLAFAAPATAQDANWPTRTMRLVIPFPAGGATDIVGRTVAQKLSEALGQNVVVENKPGAGGAIGADTVARAAPDGYTILLSTSSTHSIGPLINPKLPYDPFTDFIPVINLARAPSVLLVGASAPVDSAKALIALLKANPGKYNFGSSGIGTYPHLTGELFRWRGGDLNVCMCPTKAPAWSFPTWWVARCCC